MNNTDKMKEAVEKALEFYANSLGVSLKEARQLYIANETTKTCVNLLILAQADPEKLKAMAKLLS